MKKVGLALAVAVAATASAHAADLGAAPAKARAMVTPFTNWAGLYIGGNVGYGWGAGDFNIGPSGGVEARPQSMNTHSRGAIGGAQIGYNWQAASFVLGLEADIQGSGIRGSAKEPFFNTDANAFLPGEFLSADQKLSWFGTLRTRLGVAATPDLLLYATAGLAYGQVKASADTIFVAGPVVLGDYPAAISRTNAGWTVGAGTEWMFARNWSAKLEYLYVDLGDVSATVRDALHPAVPVTASYTWKTQDHIVRAGVNYHF